MNVNNQIAIRSKNKLKEEIKKMKSNKGFFAATAGFIKKYIYFILLFLCVAAIVTIIIIATTQKDALPPKNENQQTTNPEPEPEIPVVIKPMVFNSPLQDYVIGNDFSFTDFVWLATQGRYQTHKGIDFKAAAGTKVLAVFNGTVESVYTDIFEGTVVVLKHQDGVKTIYKSLDSNVPVRVGDTVKTGAVIGYVSDSMLYEVAEGPHLHFEVWKNNSIIDPYVYLLDLAK